MGIIETMAHNWWMLLIRGIFAVLFGIMAFLWPGLTLTTLVILFGIYALADGISAAWVGAYSKIWWLAAAGLLGVVAGIYTFMYPGMTALVLLYLIAGWMIARGVMEIVTAIQVRKAIDDEWRFILGGVLSIFAGLVLAIFPGAGALAMVWLIGAWAVVFGIVMVTLSFALHRLKESHAAPSHFHPTS